MSDGNDDDPAVTTQQQCCICREESPVTETNYTLISQKHQWRMELRTNEQGQKEPYWYCPDCWRRVKQGSSSSHKSPPRHSNH